MGCVRLASVTSEAIEAEVLLKVWDVLHPRAVGERSERSELTAGGLASSCRRQRIASHFIMNKSPLLTSSTSKKINATTVQV